MAGRYVGAVNSLGEPHGRGTLWMSSNEEGGDPEEESVARFEGRFHNGCRSGRGTMYFDEESISSLRGNWHDDELQGHGVYITDDGTVLEGLFVDGVMNGEGIERSPEGNIVFRGLYMDGMRDKGVHYLFDGGMLGGTWQDNELHGSNCFYRYPNVRSNDPCDLSSGGYYGEWQKGVMIKAVYIRESIQSFEAGGNKTNIVNMVTYHEEMCDYGISSCDDPLLEDPYENYTVSVSKSKVGKQSGEGLFAARDIQMGELCAVYAGIHLTHEEVDDRDWQLNDNTITLDEDTVIDVPSHMSSLSQYAASLGHKANHNSPNNNAEYAPLYHPRFGFVKSVVAIKHISREEEITVDYGYDDLDGTKDHGVPDWYREFVVEQQ